MRRRLQNPNYELDHDGNIWSVASKPIRKLPHATHENRFGTVHLTCVVDGREHFIWRLLGSVFHSNALILPRDGNFLNLRADNVIALRMISSPKITDPDEIHFIWRLYCDGVTCALMANKTGFLDYWVDDFKSIIKDILWAGVR